MHNNKNKIFNFLQELKNNPFVIIGEPSLTRAKHFIYGYLQKIYEDGEYEIDTIYPNLQNYVEKRFFGYEMEEGHIVKHISRHWTEIILLFSINENDAFYNLFKILDETQVYDFIHSNKKIHDAKTVHFDAHTRVLELIRKIKVKPGMYVGDKNLINIFYFIKGYLWGVYDNQFTTKLFDDFQDYVVEYYFCYKKCADIYNNLNYMVCTQYFCNIILYFSANEEQAVNTFFDLFETFLSNGRLESQEVTEGRLV